VASDDAGTETSDDTDGGGLLLHHCLPEPDCALECDDVGTCSSEGECLGALVVALRDRTPGTSFHVEAQIGGGRCSEPTHATILTSGQLLRQHAVKDCGLSGFPIRVCELQPSEYFQACIDGVMSCADPHLWITTCETLEPAPTTCEDLPQ
jgi:hypothetical protein